MAGHIIEVDWPVQPGTAGAGEIHSTAADYASFLCCMLDKSGPISTAGHEQLVEPHIIADTAPNRFWSPTLYALGWDVKSYHGEKVVGHSGGTTDFACQMMFLPDKNWGIVIFGNSINGSPAIDKICWTMIGDLLGIPMVRRFDWDREVTKNAWEYEQGRKTIKKIYPQIPEPRIPPTLLLGV